jgi:apolipoprotein N-acyltransferase
MGIIAITVLLLLLPLALLRDIFRLGRGAARLARIRRNNVPLPQKNKRRATGGAFVLVACIVLAAHGFPVIGWQITAVLAGFALLYLVVGVHGAHGATFDVMAAFWWGVLALGAAVLLGFVKLNGFPL